MIISKTPFRISFFGGGTDYPVWYEKHGGAVLSTTIDKYCYISCRYLPELFCHKYLIRYRLREEVSSIDMIRHPSVRECLKFLNIKQGIEMVHTSDLTARAGIGSSSAFTVGFLNSLYALTGQKINKKKLALNAIHIEQNLMRENVGSQDQTAAAFGGFNKIIFNGAEKINVKPVNISPKKLNLLQSHLMLFFTGLYRTASEIAGEQIKQTPMKTQELKKMRDMVDEAISILNAQDSRFNEFGKLLHETWQIKRSLTKLITNDVIDNIYNTAGRAGAIGGKLLGAGAGGFILFFVPPEKQTNVKNKLKDLIHVPFNFETAGSKIIFHEKQ